jgi:prephenate dehydrogenase
VAIVGVGLIGGSIGLSLLQKGLAKSVVGVGRSQTSLRIARRVGAITHTTIDINKGVSEAELVIVCTPVGQVVNFVQQAARHCPERALLCDVGSTKQAIVQTLDTGLPRGCRFLGCHPLAGSEKTGAIHATPTLFEGRVTVLTPTVHTRAEDFDLLEGFWEALGSVVVQMSPEEHDRALAMTSHLPHIAAAAVAAALPEKYFRLCSTGMFDTTRVAGSDPELWQQIFLMNRDNVLSALDDFGAKLSLLYTAIRDNRQEDILRFLTQAKKNRDSLGS